MIRPVNFSFNPETAVNNAFQSAATTDAQQQAQQEFDEFVRILRDNDVDVTVIEDTPEPFTPDSIFPNNWISFHEQGLICLYPMYAANRRLERKPAVLQQLSRHFRIDQTLDFSVLNRKSVTWKAPAVWCSTATTRSPTPASRRGQTRPSYSTFAPTTGYTPEIFTAVDSNGQAIYHTNVMMCVADRYVVACLDSLPNPDEREHFIHTVQSTGKTLIPITLPQMNSFAGNMLQVHNRTGERLLIMSSQAFHSLTPDQIGQLTAFNRILHSPLHNIETNGGGSARCMMAEIHLDPR